MVACKHGSGKMARFCLFVNGTPFIKQRKDWNMRASKRFLRNAIECMTQCALLPGIELHFEEVLLFYKENIGALMGATKKRRY
jgi:hypothetical protein